MGREAPFTNIPRARASSLVAEHVQRAILEGGLRPGTRLPRERDLATQFGVSRLSIREALRILESRGLVSVQVGAKGGVLVDCPNPDLIRDSLAAMVAQETIDPFQLAEARRVIEVGTAGLAAERARPADVDAMREAVQHTARALAGESNGYVDASLAFHLAVARAAQNQVLEMTLSSMRGALEMAWSEMKTLPGSLERAYRDHQALMAAIAGHDAPAARRLMALHMEDFEARLRRVRSDAPRDAGARPS